MARPREFDEKAVLEAASDIFWTKGYESTSTRELSECTGLTPSSMYAAFGDKRRLFHRALEDYLLRLRTKMARLAELASPGAAITGFFEDTIERSLEDPLHRGCMLMNSVLEVTSDDEQLRRLIGSDLTLIEDFFRERFIEAQGKGEVSKDFSAGDASQQLLAVLVGVRVLARARPERSLLTAAIAQTLRLFGLPSVASDAPTAVPGALPTSGDQK
ncbi:TetR/AcrR family transcriptional regulator [Phyllobacterium endophyticum]|uniref:TetR/AcrR family transcriptional regulator n=1 Tax=Phyllobacterium endophyticum TaxID=1149773 RepID=UPI0011C95B12|nr:TetR/AcrR family transcriptional regulator [Phyllobacterium endophyticum]TXR46573.1 TetR/AcrR family transcriptional regulator [Phyllobacterium endophyticum]